MSEITKQDLKELKTDIIEANKDYNDTSIRTAVDDLSEIMTNMMQQISGEFVKVHNRMDQIEESIDRLTNTLDGFAKRVENAEQENAMRDAQFKRLMSWAEKVSKKTGIPLETL